MRNYRDLRAWDEAHQLTLATYKVTQSFPKDEKFGLTSQIRRAAASISANLAEGVVAVLMARWGDSCRSRWAQVPNCPTICCCPRIWSF
jgi:hypothetical protein